MEYRKERKGEENGDSEMRTYNNIINYKCLSGEDFLQPFTGLEGTTRLSLQRDQVLFIKRVAAKSDFHFEMGLMEYFVYLQN